MSGTKRSRAHLIDREDFSSRHSGQVSSDGESSGFDSQLLSFVEAEVLFESRDNHGQHELLSSSEVDRQTL